MLMEAGIPVVAQRDHATMGRLLAALDPGCVVDPEARDFPDDPWFRAYFAAGPVGLPLAEFERSWRPRGRAAGSAVEGGA
jgi:hypothetical protein